MRSPVRSALNLFAKMMFGAMLWQIAIDLEPTEFHVASMMFSIAIAAITQPEPVRPSKDVRKLQMEIERLKHESSCNETTIETLKTNYDTAIECINALQGFAESFSSHSELITSMMREANLPQQRPGR